MYRLDSGGLKTTFWMRMRMWSWMEMWSLWSPKRQYQCLPDHSQPEFMSSGGTNTWSKKFNVTTIPLGSIDFTDPTNNSPTKGLNTIILNLTFAKAPPSPAYTVPWLISNTSCTSMHSPTSSMTYQLTTLGNAEKVHLVLLRSSTYFIREFHV